MDPVRLVHPNGSVVSLIAINHYSPEAAEEAKAQIELDPPQIVFLQLDKVRGWAWPGLDGFIYPGRAK